MSRNVSACPIAFLALLLCSTVPLTAGSADEKTFLRLWYSKPAAEWTQALPVGNGHMGAMIFGDPTNERIQFNEDTLWTGMPRDYSNPDAYKYLPEIRQLLFEGKQREAEALAMEHFMSIPLRQEMYQPFGDVLLRFPGHEGATDYRRSLDISRAVAAVRYTVGDAVYTRRVFASYPDRVVVIHLACNKPGSLTFDVEMTSPHQNVQVRTTGDRTLALVGRMGESRHPRTNEMRENILKFDARLLVRTEGGTASFDAGKAHIANASEATLILAAATSYRKYNDVSADPARRCQDILKPVRDQSLDELYQRHVQDYKQLFDRVSIDLGATDAVAKPTDQRIADFAKEDDPQLAALFYQFGRYLLIASSRPGSQPANLQGVWNDKVNPSWGSKYTVNINTEMNYWPAEPTNLAECHEPLFAMIENVAETGRNTARNHYDCNGWVLHHNTDLWRGTAPINHSNHGIWPTGGAWLSQHLWYHYLYTGDKEFLRTRAYPILKDAAAFFVEFLVEDPQTGWLISTPSNSPENGGLVAGPTMDHQIIRDLFDACIEASKVLNRDAGFRQLLIEKRKRIAPMQIGRYGQLQEWLEDKDDPNNKHRHASHLYGLHPSSQINWLETPKLFDAARKSLEFRGDGGTGWSMAWKINFWARLLDGDHAYKMLSNQLTPGRTYPNLFDAHPPFQIDGNFGATSGMTEMLLQSHIGQVHLLPALPAAWKEGSITGLRARGGFEVDIHWDNGRLQEALIRSTLGGECPVRYADKVVVLDTRPDQEYRLNGKLQVVR